METQKHVISLITGDIFPDADLFYVCDFCPHPDTVVLSRIGAHSLEK